MLEKVEKKLNMMNPADLTQSAVTEWVETAIRADRCYPSTEDSLGVCPANSRHAFVPRQGEINFTPEFNGL
jgi:hypothetical protein